jgi:hypothetical protein
MRYSTVTVRRGRVAARHGRVTVQCGTGELQFGITEWKFGMVDFQCCISRLQASIELKIVEKLHIVEQLLYMYILA